MTLATNADSLNEAFTAIAQARLDPLTEAQYRALLYDRARTLAGTGTLKLGGRAATAAMIRDDLVASYLELGRLTDDPELRAGYVDLAIFLRPWSFL